MTKAFSLRSIFCYLEDVERRGVFVRCPRAGRPQDIGECLPCPHYGGLHLDGDGPYRLKCASPSASTIAERPLAPYETGAA